MSPTGRTAALLGAVAVVALFVPLWLAALLALAVLTAAAADAVAVRRPVLVERTVAPILARGVPTTLELTVARGPGRVRLRQAAPPSLTVREREGDERLSTSIVGRQRGRHVLPAPAVRVDGPLGLGRWYRRSGVDETVLVYPDLPAARRLASAVRHGRFRLDGRVRGPLGLGTEFESVREYEPDDDVRQVNWKATQRIGRPMSNQYRVERDRDVICLVDCGRLMAAPLGDRTRLDAAVDAAVAVAAVADGLGDRCGTVAFDAAIQRRVTPRRAGGDAVVAALFDVESRPVESDYQQAFAILAGAKRAWVLVLTDLLERSAARPLVEALPALARRHAVAVASAVDPDVDRLLTEEPEARIDVYRSAVALQVVQARSAVAASLVHRGIAVIDAPADGLASACVQAYLRAKARALV